MIRINLKKAEGHLGELIEEAAAGEEVVITSDGGPTVRLMLVLQEGQESQDPRQPTRTVGTALDHFMGTWSAEQEAEVLKAVEIFEQVDESFWH
jgi:antitoxin (DNA-binding transcriptional repressor) of toxin-antitoxin stability system